MPVHTIKPTSFEHVVVGDIVIRMLAGIVRVDLRVTAVDDKFIHCGLGAVTCGPGDNDGWKFLRSNGCEVDETLGWDGVTGTGSYLVLEVGQEAAYLLAPKAGISDEAVVDALHVLKATEIEVLAPGFISASIPVRAYNENRELLDTLAEVMRKERKQARGG